MGVMVKTNLSRVAKNVASKVGAVIDKGIEKLVNKFEDPGRVKFAHCFNIGRKQCINYYSDTVSRKERSSRTKKRACVQNKRMRRIGKKHSR